MRLVLLGAPGAGKGTVADKLKAEFNLQHISTGDLFRSNIDQKTELGQQAQGYMNRGELVPDQVTCAMVETRMKEPDTRSGFILDGFPRTCAQAETLAKILDAAATPLDFAILVDCPDQLVLKRIADRRVCQRCGRSYNVVTMPSQKAGFCDHCGGQLIQRADDRPETVAARLETYHQKTAPLIDYYQDKDQLITFDNSGDFNQNFATLMNRLRSQSLSNRLSSKIC